MEKCKYEFAGVENASSNLQEWKMYVRKREERFIFSTERQYKNK